MSVNVGSIHYDLDLDTNKFDAAHKAIGSKLSGIGNAMADLGKKIAVGMAVATAASVAYGVSAVKAFNETEVAQAALEHAVVGVTHATKEQLKQTEDLANALEKKGVLDGDNIKLGLAQLSTFGLSNKAVQKLGGSLADLAVNQYGVNASGEQLSDTANMIAKALNGQFGVLEKSGIRFTQAQKNIIEYGTEMQKVDAINQGFAQNLKFTNETALTTTAGKLAKLRVSLENIKESIGKVIVDGLLPFISKAAVFIAAIDWDKKIATTTEYIKNFWHALKGEDVNASGVGGKIVTVGRTIHDFALILKDLAIDIYNVGERVFNYLEPKFVALWHTINTKLMPILEKLWHNVIEPLAPVIGTVLVAAIGFAVDALNILITAITATINWFDKNRWALDALILVLGTAALAFGALKIAMAMGAAVTAFQGAMVAVTTSFTAMAMVVATPFAIAILVGAALLAIGSVISEYQKLQKEIAAAKAATEGAKRASDDYISSLYRAVEAGRMSAQQAETNRIKFLQGQGQASGLPQYASGTDYAQKGLALVGEKGPELVQMRGGERVYTNDQTNAMMGGAGNTSTNIYGNITIGSQQDADNFFARLSRNQELSSKRLATMAGSVG